MGNSDDFSSNIVVESVHRTGVNKAVAYPQACLHNLLNLTKNLQIKVTLIKYRKRYFQIAGRLLHFQIKLIITTSENTWASCRKV